MALTRATVGGRITSAIINAIIDLLELVPFTVGMKPIVPTSVAGSGVSVGTRGKVTFTTASTISLNGIFTSTYDTYKIVFDCSATSTSAGGTLRLRLAGTDNSSAVYAFQQTTAAATTVATTTGTTGTSWGFTAVSGTEHYFELTLNAPALARATRGRIDTGTWTGNTANTQTKSELRHSATSAFDGLSIIASTGNMTGSLTVYGYNTNV